ncbi:hypothetical protein [Aquimarina litoralis]|uniref:hypothetical protein n=1 Tax=Aquimarina litoralis TaxID=584605 RepID=UPI001C590B57|nr:hypothetical protein [Aquimarina litoralis]MBW1296380.1 hypothetical protein [Aquimarina litoralis]
MKKIVGILRNNWTLRTVAILMAIYVGVSYVFGDGLKISEIIIFALVFFYFVWGFGKKPIRNKNTQN